MARSIIWLRTIIAVLFAFICFSFFQYYCTADLFAKELTSDFRFSSGCFASYLHKPAWLACYLGDSLANVFLPVGGGAFLMTAVFLAEWWIITWALDRFEVGNMRFIYAFFPVMMEVGGYCGYSYQLHSILSFMIVLLVFLRYTYISTFWQSFFYAFFMLPVIYILAGGRLFIYVILILLYDAYKNERRWFFWTCLLISGTAMPDLLRPIYALSEDQAYQFPHSGLFAFFPSILFAFGVMLLQFKNIREMRVNVVNISVITVLLVGLLVLSVFSEADF